MIIKWVLIAVISSYGYGATSQKIEGIQSKAECNEMGQSIKSQMDDFSRTQFSCTPYTVYEEQK